MGTRLHQDRAERRARWGEFKRKAAGWVDERLSVLPFHWRRRAAAEYARLAACRFSDGNAWLRDVSDLARGRVSLAASDGEIVDAAKRAALAGFDLCRLGAPVRSVVAVRERLLEHCAAWGVAAPSCGGAPAVARMLCQRWWVRRLRAAVARRCEAAAIGAQLVCRGVWPYASQDGVDRRRSQRARNAQAVARADLLDMDSGERIKLSAVVDSSIANPEIKRAELMVRIRGCEEVATSDGHVAEFWTLTTPSRFHAQRMAGSVAEPNPLYDQSRPDAAQRYLRSVWARARAAWQRRGLVVYGMRVAEPHHDATPHWHVLVFGSSRDLRFARRLLRVYALRDSAAEHGARLHRFKVDQIRPEKGDAAGYVAKYVAKNIDGFGVGIDGETGKRASIAVRRCDAWAAAWHIRQFQFFGLPSVTVWRALRKVREAVADGAIEAVRVAADVSDWAAYILAQRAHPVKILYSKSARLNSYGEAAAPVAVAFVSASGRVLLEQRNFLIGWGGFCLPRTRVNNCTRSAGGGSRGAVARGRGEADIDGAAGNFHRRN